MIDTKPNKDGANIAEVNLLSCDEQLPSSETTKALGDVQNESRTGNSTEKSPLPKDSEQKMDPAKVSGNKRPSPEDSRSPSCYQSPSNNASTQLVYVRRKSEAEISKTTACDGKTRSADLPPSQQLNQQETTQSDKLIYEPKAPCSPAFSPMPVGSLMSAPGKASAPLPNGQPRTMYPSAPSSFHHAASAASPSNNPVDERNLHWEERYRQLQMLLKKLDESDKEEYVQMLWPLSSVELSRHAVELEKRSIELSLEEAREMHRVKMLNVLGNSMNNFEDQKQG